MATGATRNEGLQLEGWAHRIIDLVEAGHNVEDSRVELKADWPADTAKAARQLAGHLNASQSPDVLWLIGVDEKRAATGCEPMEASTWWRSVCSKFDETSPTMILERQIVRSGQSVSALLFSTDRAPFVVKNPDGGSHIHREVPWREGRSTRTAHRSDLVRLLEPMIMTPEIEVRGAELDIMERERDQYGQPVPPGSIELRCGIEIYLEPYPGVELALPDHRARIDLRWGKRGAEHHTTPVHIYAAAPFRFPGRDAPYEPPHSVAAHRQITIYGPGLYSANESWTVDRWRWSSTVPVSMRLSMRPSRSSSIVSAVAQLKPTEVERSDLLASWRFVPTESNVG